MPWAAAAAIGSAVVGAGASIYSSNKAADASQAAANKATALQAKQFEETRGDLATYRDTGSQANSEYAALNGLQGPDAQAAAWGRFRADPGYQFALDQGNKSIEASAAARGGVLNGGTLKALDRFGQGTADQQYNTYLDRFLKLSSQGENAAAQTGNLGAEAAAREGGYVTDAGNAQAGSYLNAGQQVNGAIGNALKFYSYDRGNQPQQPTYDRTDTGFGQAYLPRG